MPLPPNAFKTRRPVNPSIQVVVVLLAFPLKVGKGGQDRRSKRRVEIANDARAPPMAAQPQTLALAGLILLNFLLTAAALYVQLRRLLRTRRRDPQQQQPHQQPIPQPPGTEAAAREPPAPAEGEGEEHGDEGGREEKRRRRRARRRRQPQEEGAGGGGDAAAAAPSAKAAGREGKAEKEEPLPRRRPQFPLASVAGTLQRRINERYDDLARASEARCLTIEQVRCGARIPSHSLFYGSAYFDVSM